MAKKSGGTRKPDRTHRTQRKGAHTPEAEERFLAALRKGKSIAGAAAAACVGRRTVYDWRDRNAAFAAKWDEAFEEGTDYLEDLALKSAEKGSERLLIALLKARRPDRYQRMIVEHEGRLELLLRNASETLDAKLARLR